MTRFAKKDALASNTSSSTLAFHSETSLPVPTLDIVSFALTRLEEYDPNKAIYVDAKDPSSKILVGEVKSKVEQISAGLKEHGVTKGDCVCIHSFNSIYYPVLWLAIIAAGGIVTGSNPAYTSAELTHHFKTTDTKFIIAQQEHCGAVKESVSQCTISAKNVFVLGANMNDVHPFTPWEVLWKPNAGPRVSFDDAELQESTIAVHAATSGTTGLPKAAELSHKYFIAQATTLEYVFTKRKQDIRQLICLPVFHAFAAQLAIVLPLRLGITTYFMPRFDHSAYIHNVRRYQITDSAVVPPIINGLMSHHTMLDENPFILHSLRYIICAGAPMCPATQLRLYRYLHSDATITQCWGATELGWITLFNQCERDDTGSVGNLLPNTSVKIIDECGNMVTSDNVPGEAFVNSASMIIRYHNNTIANTDLFDHEGYYRTGDIVRMLDGKLYIEGRTKDIMKINGWQVSPEEIECAILELEDIIDCAVTSLRFKVGGVQTDHPRAFVVRRDGSRIQGREIVEYVAKRLISYKRLSGGVIFVDSIPRSNTGKILRRNLQEVKTGGFIGKDESVLNTEPRDGTVNA